MQLLTLITSKVSAVVGDTLSDLHTFTIAIIAIARSSYAVDMHYPPTHTSVKLHLEGKGLIKSNNLVTTITLIGMALNGIIYNLYQSIY